MKKKENPKTKNRWYTAILYHDDPKFDDYMKKIQEQFYYVTYIDHDRDLLDDGTPKKNHRHMIFYVGENARHIESVAGDIGIPSNYLEGCKKEKMLLYFLHINHPTKALYNIEAVHGPLKEELQDLITKQTSEYKRLKTLIEDIREKKPRSIWELLLLGVETKNMDIIKKYQLILTKIIDEQKRL